jgi:hypothetical protein
MLAALQLTSLEAIPTTGTAIRAGLAPRGPLRRNSLRPSACPGVVDASEEFLEAHALVHDLGHNISLLALQLMVPRKKAETVAEFHAWNARRES